jgi:putative transposase
VIFAWIGQRLGEKEKDCSWPLRVMCGVLKASRSGYYAWRGRGPGKRREQRMKWIEQIRRSHEQSRRTYGSPRVAADLKAQGVKICENTVAKLMKQEALAVKLKRRFVPRTTDSSHDCPIAPNRLGRDFCAGAANSKWTCDITYVPSDQGWLYLSVVMDLFSRRIVGWSMRPHLRGELTGEALTMAIQTRRPGPGLLHHSDRGVQYACAQYQQKLLEAGMQPSMSRTGDCYDNAVTESFFGTLKTELINRQHYTTHEQARQSMFEWIEVFYNRQRRHSSLGYLSPEAFEAKMT